MTHAILPNVDAATDPDTGAILVIDDVHYAYRARAALKGVSLTIAPGEVLVLLGPNGAGKSTLVKTISGRRRPLRGRVRIAGGNPADDAGTRRMVGLVPQQLAVYPKLTGLENLVIFARLMGLTGKNIPARARDVLALVGLGDRADHRVETFSGGMQRRVNIAAALMHEPRLLVLDEPTVGVDIGSRQSLVILLKSLTANGYAILLTTHDMQEAEAMADRVAILIDGEIKACGTPAAVVEEVFGGRREITLALPGMRRSLPNAEYDPRPGALGLQKDEAADVWRGLVDIANPKMRAMLDDVLHDYSGAVDVRVRQPGLDTLLSRFLVTEASA